MSPHVDVFHNRRSVQPGDVFLLTCDGVTDYLSDDALLRLALQDQTPEQIADCVVKAAIDRGSDDDATAVVIRYIQADT